MTPHIEAKKGEIADFVLLPGDPLRAEIFAKNFLTDVKCYNKVRNAFGFTGNYKGKRVSIQGTGMGMPSMAIYAYELIHNYDVKHLVRVGTAGAVVPDLKVGEVILATGAGTNSKFFDRFHGLSYGFDMGSYPDFNLLLKLNSAAKELKHFAHLSPVFSSDTFYSLDKNFVASLAKSGLKAVEMEAFALFTLASHANVSAAVALTVSDNIITGDASSSSDRQNQYLSMAEIALEAALKTK